MRLRTFLRLGAAALSLGTLGLAAPVPAQTAQGQFTPDASAPIQLHMPVHLHAPAQRRAPKHKTKPAAQPAALAPAATKSTAAQQPSRSERRKAVREVLSAPASTTSTSDASVDVSAPSGSIPFSFDSSAPPPPPPRQKSSAAVPKPKAARPPRDETEVASREPPPPETPAPKPPADPHAGLTKKGEVLFSGSDIDPKPDSADALKAMASNLNSALDSGAARVELEAFGGAPGDKSSDARRLSLRRALAVRQLLIDSGIPANRIDVRALGSADDHGDADRVDVYLRGAS